MNRIASISLASVVLASAPAAGQDSTLPPMNAPAVTYTTNLHPGGHPGDVALGGAFGGWTAFIAHGNEVFRHAVESNGLHLAWGSAVSVGAGISVYALRHYVRTRHERNRLRAHCDTLPPFRARTDCRRAVENSRDRGRLLREWDAAAAE